MSDLVTEWDFPGEQEALLPMFAVRQCARSHKKAADPADTILRWRISIPASQRLTTKPAARSFFCAVAGSTARHPIVQRFLIGGRIRGELQLFHRLSDEVNGARNDHKRFAGGLRKRLSQR